MRRFVYLVVTLFTMFLALGSLWAASESEQEVATVTYWHTMSDPETRQLERVIADFEAINPEIKIEATKFAYDDFKTAILTGVAGGDAPDAAALTSSGSPSLPRKAG